ncbi:DUF4192 domain-containing protein [Thermomonospora cellulosilytica]|uniref:DUF4192 domain-containing protein n=1 Tax=Thermomonospora cellulosilytica TaxID=1411118 RepID=A0A7W3MYQ4_9ACTN|nr:DUF4192 domain-containing protein [Thermomonospora cellulosilytica]MBA9004328.1 hypothetical protein [Thermomonospora cellulosilytica]
MNNPTARADRPTLTIRSPQDAVSAVPYLLGFHPAHSLVAVGYAGTGGNTCAMRLDLPHPGEADLAHSLADRVAEALTRNGFHHAMLLGYGDAEHVAPVIDVTRRSLEAHGISIQEALRVHDGRWWSYLCDNPGCCPADGTPYDISSSIVAAEATLAGHAAYPDRDALVESVRRLPDTDGRIRAATGRAERRLIGWIATGRPSKEIRADMVKEAVPLVTRLTAAVPDALPTDDETAWLGVLLTDLRVRDEAWVRINADDPANDITLWRHVVQRVHSPYVPAPACLLAYAAYCTGDGGLANVALDRAAEADPAYSLAALLREVIHAAIPPSRARLHMTPEQLATAYAEQEEPTPP